MNICFVIGCAYSRLCDIRTSYRRIDSVLFVFQNSCVCFREIAADHEKNTADVLKKKEGWGGGCGARSGSGNVDMNCQISGCTQRNLYRTRWCNRWASACGHCQIFGQSYIKIILFYHRRCHWKGRTAVKCVWQEKGEIWAAKQFPCLKMVFATRWGFWGRMEGVLKYKYSSTFKSFE